MDYEYLVTPEQTSWSFDDAVLYGMGAGVIALTIAFVILCAITVRIRYPYEGQKDVAAKSVIAALILGAMVFSGTAFAVAPRLMTEANAEHTANTRSAWLTTNYSWLADEQELLPHLLAEDRFSLRMEDRNGVYWYDFRFTRTDRGTLLMYGKEKEELKKFRPLLQNHQYRPVKVRENALYDQLVAGTITQREYYFARYEWTQRLNEYTQD